MFSVSASIPDAEVKAISATLSDFGKKAPNAVAMMTRKAACYTCDSCRHLTRKAHKYPSASEYKIVRPKWGGDFIIGKKKRKIPTPSPYVTYDKGVRKPIDLRRYEITKRIGTDRQNKFIAYAYTHIKRNKAGVIVSDGGAEKAELKRVHLQLFHRGLAKQSWNWAKGEIAGGAARGKDVVWRRRKNDRRNPRLSVSGKFSKRGSGDFTDVTAVIDNRISYIGFACPNSSVAQAVQAAKAKLSWAVDEYWKKFAQRMELGSKELMETPTFLDNARWMR